MSTAEGFTLFTAMLAPAHALMQLFRVDLVDEEAVAKKRRSVALGGSIDRGAAPCCPGG